MQKSKINTVLRRCKICDKEFYTTPQRVKIGYGKFCSRKCYAISITQNEPERFLRKILPEDNNGCMLWIGLRDKDGYGKFTTLSKKSVRAHRYMWELTNGIIPKELCVLHHCDNPPCVNPKHLFLGTNQDNANDKVIKKRSAHGIKHGNSKLTEEDVRTIRQMYKDGYSQRKIAKMYGVVKSTIRIIIIGKTWKHIK